MPRLRTDSRAITVTSTSTRRQLQALRLLFRVELSSMVALSAFAGYLFAGGLWQLEAFLAAAGTGLLAAGCSALNQWQEQDLDQRMERTRSRPLVTGLFTPELVLLLASLCLAGGVFILSLLPAGTPLLLGILAIIWYNAIYTPLKRRTHFAALPGAICGALAPMIGWTAAGGMLLTQKSLILAGTMFVWQIPHTWLLLCRYRNDLKRSGLPDLFSAIPLARLLKINNCWVMSLFLCYLLFPLFGYIKAPTLDFIFIVGLLMIFIGIYTTSRKGRSHSAGHSFHLVNISMALLLTVLILDRFLLF